MTNPKDTPSGIIVSLMEEIKQLAASEEKPSQELLIRINDLLSRELIEREAAEEKLKKYQEQLRKLALELSLTEERERRSIACDLHDHIGQGLALIRTKLIKLQGDAIFCGYDRNISAIRELLEQTIQYTRTLTFEISPPILYELGLEATLEWLAEQAENKYHLQVVVKVSGKPQELASDILMVIYKAVRELVINAAKHSQIKVVEVYLEWEAQGISLRVKDNGVGFDTWALETYKGEQGGFGLFSIKERLRCLGGKMEIQSQIGKGAEIFLSLPLNSEPEMSKDGN